MTATYSLLRAKSKPVERFAWPAEPEAWINYHPAMVIRPLEWRYANKQETPLAEALGDRWRALKSNYRLRWPILDTGDYHSVLCTGDCMGDLLPHNSVVLFDRSTPYCSGDLVECQLSEETHEMIKRYQAKTGQQPMDPRAGRRMVKLYLRFDGRDLLLNHQQAIPLGDNRITGVARTVTIGGRPAYIN